MPSLKLSLCCISNTLAERGVKFQTMTYTRFASLPRDEAVRVLSSRILNNFQVTRKTIEFCVASGYAGYRMSSSITPLIDHPNVNLTLDQLPDFDLIVDEIDNISKVIKASGIRISAHPSEYISLTSEDPRVIENSLRDLETHGTIFDLIGLPQNYWAPLNIHIRKESNPEHISKIFYSNFQKLSKSVKSRLVLENNDNKKGFWSVKNLYEIFYKRYGIAITYDNLHDKMLSHSSSPEESFNLAYSTWPTIPIFHYSEGINGTRNHADYAIELPKTYGKEVYLECELKKKDYAIKDIMNRAS
jgi:UV DNA damage endonuclease